MANENTLPEASMPDIDRGIENIVRGGRPVLTLRSKPVAPVAGQDTRNPFSAIDRAHRALVGAHEHLFAVVSKLVGEMPPYEPSQEPPTGGLLGLTCMAGRDAERRAEHIEMMTARLEEHLQ